MKHRNAIDQEARSCQEARRGEQRQPVASRHSLVLGVAAALAAAGVAMACGNSIDDTGLGNDTIGDNNGPGGPGSPSGGGGPGTVGPDGTPGGAIDIPGTTPGAPVDPDPQTCAGTMATAQNPAIDMYIILDHSGSMGADCPLDLTQPPDPPAGGGGGGGNNDNPKWCFASHALAQYFTSPNAGGNRAALQFMSLANDFVLPPGSNVGDYVCQAGENNPHSTPAVGLSELPIDGTHALIQAIEQDGPGLICDTNGSCAEDNDNLGTLIEPALDGIATFTAANAQPDRTMIGILITDGDPNNCEEDDIDALADIIGTHFTDTGLRTFIIGMDGATLDNLQTMAEAGGAPPHDDFCGDGGNTPCNYWSVGLGDPATFVAALEQIQATAILPCEYLIPDPPAGQVFDTTLVNVAITPPGGTNEFFGRANSEAECGAGANWFFDDNANPTRILLCPTACERATSAVDGTIVNVELGCASRPPILQ